MLITFYKNSIINSTFTAVYSMPTNEDLAQHPWVFAGVTHANRALEITTAEATGTRRH